MHDRAVATGEHEHCRSGRVCGLCRKREVGRPLRAQLAPLIGVDGVDFDCARVPWETDQPVTPRPARERTAIERVHLAVCQDCDRSTDGDYGRPGCELITCSSCGGKNRVDFVTYDALIRLAGATCPHPEGDRFAGVTVSTQTTG